MFIHLLGYAAIFIFRKGEGELGMLRIHIEREGAGQSSVGIVDSAAIAGACRPLSKLAPQ
jgi:hypothetical protein